MKLSCSQKLGTAARKSGKKGDEDAPEDPAEKYRKLYDVRRRKKKWMVY